MIDVTKSQEDALAQLTELTKYKINELKIPFEHTWFTRHELMKITDRTLYALVNKDYLVYRYRAGKGTVYYRLIDVCKLL